MSGIDDDLFVRRSKGPRPHNETHKWVANRTRERIKNRLCTVCGTSLNEENIYKTCPGCRRERLERHRNAYHPHLVGQDLNERNQRASTSSALRRLNKPKQLDRLPGRNALTPRTGNNWSPIEKKLLQDLFAKETPLEEICIALGRSPYAIFRYGHKLGIQHCDPNNFATPYLADRMRYW
jgi:hypothetical protein